MVKEKLITGSLWEKYSKKVHDRMNNPLFRGEITEEEAAALGCDLVIADYGAEACGDQVTMYWAVDPNDDKIKLARFRSFGCGTAIASSDVTTELCIGKTVEQTLTITNLVVERALRDKPDVPAVPPQKMHCSVMSHDVLKRAVSLYKGISVDELEDQAMVCQCARVNLGTIKDAIKLNDLSTVDDVMQYTKAGAFCGSCIRPGGHDSRNYYIEDILNEMVAQRELEKVLSVQPDFMKLTFVQKIHAVDKTLDALIRPILSQDGGNLEVVDIKTEGERVSIVIQYTGACSGCGSSNSTLSVIQNALREKLHPSINVIEYEEVPISSGINLTDGAVQLSL